MPGKITKGMEAELARQTVIHTAQAEAVALNAMYRDTLAAFLATPQTLPLPRAARAMYWLGRLRQWRAIDLSGGDILPATNWLSLQLGVVEALAGTHALAMHKEQWSGPCRRQVYERDMALQIAMLLALDWKELAAFALESWFEADAELTGTHQIGGMAGMIVSIAGDGLGIPVPPATFQKADAALAQARERWRMDESTFAATILQLAERRMRQCRLDSGANLFDFDHPVEQAIPVELLMLMRLRGAKTVPPWLATHPVMQHPAAALVHPGAPAQSQRCTQFMERVTRLLPQYGGLPQALLRQAERLQAA
ncbi:hypothetical protein [Cupriavidus plantarum]|uniref:hypothetical protein n=1 Tax=Cupriavidus plantarum TaxID=942865 RepID=UPI000EAF20DA|nr:hypothetical protein [Cupriavidus plantarum]RLK33508.1 hypothetical protein C7417_4156 [Cupriavidus plantarum]